MAYEFLELVGKISKTLDKRRDLCYYDSRIALCEVFGQMYPESEILFPTRCIGQLANLRGPDWYRLVEYVTSLTETHEDSLAFSLMMIKFNSCLTCDLDSYRASLGCSTCAKRMVAGFKGSDKVLHRRFEEARQEVIAYLEATGQRVKPARRRRSVIQPVLARAAR